MMDMSFDVYSPPTLLMLRDITSPNEKRLSEYTRTALIEIIWCYIHDLGSYFQCAFDGPFEYHLRRGSDDLPHVTSSIVGN